MALPTPRVATVFWALFGFDGRISRQTFWLGFALMTALTAVALTPYRSTGVLPEEPDLYFFVLAVLLLWSEVALAVKRLHDRGLSGLFVLLLALPFVNVALFVFLGLVPGEPRANRYGPGPDRRG